MVRAIALLVSVALLYDRYCDAFRLDVHSESDQSVLKSISSGSSAQTLSLDQTKLMVTGPCSGTFNNFDQKWSDKATINLVSQDDWEQFLYEIRASYEPQSKETCTLSSSVGSHAFIIASLMPFLKETPAEGAVVDVGSGTGFLLAAFACSTKGEVDVVGVEMDEQAAADSVVTSRKTLQDLQEEPLGASWKHEPVVIPENGLTFKYSKPFSVMNIGFASTALPSHFLELTADNAVIMMPICDETPEGSAEKCKCHFHMFTIQNREVASDTRVGPEMHYFYVPT